MKKSILILMVVGTLAISRFCFGWGILGLTTGIATGNIYSIITGIGLLTYNQSIVDDKIKGD